MAPRRRGRRGGNKNREPPEAVDPHKSDVRRQGDRNQSGSRAHRHQNEGPCRGDIDLQQQLEHFDDHQHQERGREEGRNSQYVKRQGDRNRSGSRARRHQNEGPCRGDIDLEQQQEHFDDHQHQERGREEGRNSQYVKRQGDHNRSGSRARRHQNEGPCRGDIDLEQQQEHFDDHQHQERGREEGRNSQYVKREGDRNRSGSRARRHQNEGPCRGDIDLEQQQEHFDDHQHQERGREEGRNSQYVKRQGDHNRSGSRARRHQNEGPCRGDIDLEQQLLRHLKDDQHQDRGREEGRNSQYVKRQGDHNRSGSRARRHQNEGPCRGDIDLEQQLLRHLKDDQHQDRGREEGRNSQYVRQQGDHNRSGSRARRHQNEGPCRGDIDLEQQLLRHLKDDQHQDRGREEGRNNQYVKRQGDHNRSGSRARRHQNEGPCRGDIDLEQQLLHHLKDDQHQDRGREELRNNQYVRQQGDHNRSGSIGHRHQDEWPWRWNIEDEQQLLRHLKDDQHQDRGREELRNNQYVRQQGDHNRSGSIGHRHQDVGPWRWNIEDEQQLLRHLKDDQHQDRGREELRNNQYVRQQGDHNRSGSIGHRHQDEGPWRWNIEDEQQLYHFEYQHQDRGREQWRNNQADQPLKRKGVVREINGDLFTAPKTSSLAHCVAEDMCMGAGIAVTFRQMFKRVDELLAQRARTGSIAVLEDEGRFIYYLVTKKASNLKPHLESLRSSLINMREHMLANNVRDVAMPRIGCGLDRLEWRDVRSTLIEIFGEDDVNITVYNFNEGWGKHRPRSQSSSHSSLSGKMPNTKSKSADKEQKKKNKNGKKGKDSNKKGKNSNKKDKNSNKKKHK